MAKYNAMPRREGKTNIANENGVTFGQMIRSIRLNCGISLRKASQQIGISAAYLSDLENDKRYPPVGDLLKKIISIYHVDPDTEYTVMELIGLARIEIAPDMEEFLRGNQFARLMVRRMMQVESIDRLAVDNEEEALKISQAIDVLVAKGDIIRPIGDEDGD